MQKQQLDFLRAVVPGALASEREYGIPASVTIAQAIIESATDAGWGTSRLFSGCNNPFGIKYCHFGEQPGSSIPDGYGEFETETWEVENGERVDIDDGFQRFPNLAEAFRCHAEIIATHSRFAPAMAVKGNPGEFAERLGPETPEEKAGKVPVIHCTYSTNPAYGSVLMGYVRMYGLSQPEKYLEA